MLAVPRLGTLNAHMGVLPRYRGMNVTEWARFVGGPVGCTVHLIDQGIDTGPILQIAEVDSSHARSIQELRKIVDTVQLTMLGNIMRWIWTTGTLPPQRPQELAEGVQFFRMHGAVRGVLESELASAGGRLPHASRLTAEPSRSLAGLDPVGSGGERGGSA